MAGVNPSISEIDAVDGIQNPVFGIITPRYVKGFERPEMENMIRNFGRRMGLDFDRAALDYIFKRYGGHPLLTRMACSTIHQELASKKVQRPFTITDEYLDKTAEERDEELLFYCRHVVSELREFYQEEYLYLEMLAAGEVADTISLASEPQWTRHLRNYGVINVDKVKGPTFAIPVVGRYIALDTAGQEKRNLLKRVTKLENRAAWLSRRLPAIIREARNLEKLVKQSPVISELYGNNSFPESDRFSSITIVDDEDKFSSFINVCNRCFVEPIDLRGSELNKPSYYQNEIKGAFPDLWIALHRIRTYRNSNLHIALKPKVVSDFEAYLAEDLDGKRISEVPDAWFVLQQRTLDGLLYGILCEVNRYS
jgi:hypothetical protein